MSDLSLGMNHCIDGQPAKGVIELPSKCLHISRVWHDCSGKSMIQKPLYYKSGNTVYICALRRSTQSILQTKKLFQNNNLCKTDSTGRNWIKEYGRRLLWHLLLLSRPIQTIFEYFLLKQPFSNIMKQTAMATGSHFPKGYSFRIFPKVGPKI